MSGNPGGRPKGFAAQVREATNEGEELIRTALGIMRNRRAAARDRLRAVVFLADRGWGRPPEQLDVEMRHDLAPAVFDDWPAEKLLPALKRAVQVLELEDAKTRRR